MVSFTCDKCGDVLTKKKLEPHYNRCWNAYFTCIDCMKDFHNKSWMSHTNCMSEAQKYQGALYKEKKPKGQAQNKTPVAVNPNIVKHAYVEDAPESPEPSVIHASVTKVNIPPRAPSPPTSSSVPVNVFDYLQPESPGSPASSVSSASAPRSRKGTSATNGAGAGITPVPRSKGEALFTYGNAPIESTLQHYNSDVDVSMSDAHDTTLLPTRTPAPRHASIMESQSMRQSDKKRKRGQLDEIEGSVARPSLADGQAVLHSGLTGGLDRLLKAPNSHEQPSPLSPKKRSKRTKDEAETVAPRKHKEEGRSRRTKEDEDGRALVKVDTSKDDKGRRRSERRAIEGGKEVKTLEYSGANGVNQQALIKPGSKAVVSLKQKPEQSNSEFFLNLVDKGAESLKGQSVYGLLKTFHEGLVGGVGAMENEDKKLFRGLRMKKGRHGEIILFSRPEAELEGL